MAREQPNWSIRDLDHQVLVPGQFPIENVRVAVGGTVADVARFGAQDGVAHWVGGKTRTISFDTVLYAKQSTHGPLVRKLLGMFTALATKDDALGRPPICLFRWGKAVAETVVVEAIDPAYVSLLDTGEPREVRLSISLRRYSPFSQARLDPTKPAKESAYVVASEVERSYEAIAARLYGDALLGDRLRKRMPRYPLAPPIGEAVKAPARAVLLRERVAPAFHVLDQDDATATAAVRRIWDDRAKRRVVLL